MFSKSPFMIEFYSKEVSENVFLKTSIFGLGFLKNVFLKNWWSCNKCLQIILIRRPWFFSDKVQDFLAVLGNIFLKIL